MSNLCDFFSLSSEGSSSEVISNTLKKYLILNILPEHNLYGMEDLFYENHAYFDFAWDKNDDSIVMGVHNRSYDRSMSAFADYVNFIKFPSFNPSILPGTLNSIDSVYFDVGDAYQYPDNYIFAPFNIGFGFIYGYWNDSNYFTLKIFLSDGNIKSQSNYIGDNHGTVYFRLDNNYFYIKASNDSGGDLFYKINRINADISSSSESEFNSGVLAFYQHRYINTGETSVVDSGFMTTPFSSFKTIYPGYSIYSAIYKNNADNNSYITTHHIYSEAEITILPDWEYRVQSDALAPYGDWFTGNTNYGNFIINNYLFIKNSITITTGYTKNFEKSSKRIRFEVQEI